MSLDRVRDMAARKRAVDEEMRESVVAAAQAGAAIADIANAAQVSRQTIYRWLAMAGADPGPRGIDVMRTGAEVMAAYLDPYDASEILKRLTKDERQVIRALKMATAWLPPSAWKEMTPEERTAVGLATAARNAIERVERTS